ncbi:MAG: hypothetical protein IKQ40_05230 [Lachnospiraceae bacterium]|nr:hypothetical protein [Lachnospiraceae bacterium]
MKKRKTWQIVLFTMICVCLNIGGKLISVWLELPLWADSFGTALCACLAGPICGAMVGFTGNMAYCVVNHLSAAYSLTSIALGIIVGVAARRKMFDRFYGFMVTASLAVVTSLAVSVPINLIFDSGYTGNKWGNGVVDYLLNRGWPPALCCVFGQLALEFADKVLTILAVYVVVILRRQQKNRKKEKEAQQAGSVAAAVILAFLFCLPLTLPVEAAQVVHTDTTDYNDYVQSIYSNNNGLPCGEANDIAQTNDGVLWIGTYAGLYRYNGREFRWVDNYESVRNVNCLYVDEEGRLWIGTNDNGLSIAIREKVVNVLDETSGLPSNSVRCIIRATDGYYYVGTTSSMQIIVMNNGLKATNTLKDVSNTDSITADQAGHVATVDSAGRLFLMKGGEVLCSLKLPEENELFNCCAFSPDGTLMVGSSTDHIYSYDVSGDDLKQKDVMTCEEVSGINNLNYLSDGTLFVSTDSGVSYIDADGYHHLNTNEFNNSIDKMLYDYQGNLWFTSSRLGLLRLANRLLKMYTGPSEWNARWSTRSFTGRTVITSGPIRDLTSLTRPAATG